MSDRDLRALERSVDPTDGVRLLREQIRAGQLLWVPPIPGGPGPELSKRYRMGTCTGHVGGWHAMDVRSCSECDGTGTVYLRQPIIRAMEEISCTCDEGHRPADPRAIIRIRAFAGDESALEFVKTHDHYDAISGSLKLSSAPWVASMLIWVAGLPILRGWLDEECIGCSNAPGEGFPHTGEHIPGKQTRFWNPEVWVSMQIALKLAQAVMLVEVAYRKANPQVRASCDMSTIGKFVDVVYAWVRCPCVWNTHVLEQERVEIGNEFGWIGDGINRPGYWLPLWVRDAIAIIGNEEGVRELICTTLLEMLQ